MTQSIPFLFPPQVVIFIKSETSESFDIKIITSTGTVSTANNGNFLNLVLLKFG